MGKQIRKAGEMSLSDKEFCIKCDGGGKVLRCSSSICPLSIHEECLGFPAKFDEMGRFYCPYCAYKKVSEELNLAQERNLLRKKALLNFLDKESVNEDCQTQEFRNSNSREPAQVLPLDNENHLEGVGVPEDNTLLEKADQQQDRFSAGCSKSVLQSEDSDGPSIEVVEETDEDNDDAADRFEVVEEIDEDIDDAADRFEVVEETDEDIDDAADRFEVVEETDEDIDDAAYRFEMVNTINSAPPQPQKKQGVHQSWKTVENHVKDDSSVDPFVTENQGGESFSEVEKVDNDARAAQETVGNIERKEKEEEQVHKNVALPQGDRASVTDLNGKRLKHKDKNRKKGGESCLVAERVDTRTVQETVGNIEGIEEVEEPVHKRVTLPRVECAAVQGNLMKKRSEAGSSTRTDSETELNGKHCKYKDKNKNKGGESCLEAGKIDYARTAEETVGNMEGTEKVEEQVHKNVASPQGDRASVQGNVVKKKKKRSSEAEHSTRMESETELNGKHRKYKDKNRNKGGERFIEAVKVYTDARSAEETVSNIKKTEEVEGKAYKNVTLPQIDCALVQGNLVKKKKKKKKKRRSEAEPSTRMEAETELNGKRTKYKHENKNKGGVSYVEIKKVDNDAWTPQETVGTVEGSEEVEEPVHKIVALPQGDRAEVQVNVIKKKRRSEADCSTRMESETELNGKRRKYKDKYRSKGGESILEANKVDNDARTAEETVGNMVGTEKVEEQVHKNVALPQGDRASVKGNVVKKKKKRSSEAEHSTRMESETELNSKHRKYKDKNRNKGGERFIEAVKVYTDARSAEETVSNIKKTEEVEEKANKNVTSPQIDCALVQGNLVKKKKKKRGSEAEPSTRMESETESNGKRHKYKHENKNKGGVSCLEIDKVDNDARTSQEAVSIVEGNKEVEDPVHKKAAFPQGDRAEVQVIVIEKKRRSEAECSTRTESETELNSKRRKYKDKYRSKGGESILEADKVDNDARISDETVDNIEGIEEVEELVHKNVSFPQGDNTSVQGNVFKKSEVERLTCKEAETELNGKCHKYNDRNSNKSTYTNGTSHTSTSALLPNKLKRTTVPALTKVIYDGRRQKLPWRDEEVNMLKEGFEKISSDKLSYIPWKKILEYGRHVFDGTRTPHDLKDKWRNMQGRVREV